MKQILVIFTILVMSLGAFASPDAKFVQFIDQQIRAYENSSASPELESNLLLMNTGAAQNKDYDLSQVWVRVLAQFSVPLGLFRMSLVPEVELEFGK